jgi:hypothetical protein
MLFELSKSTHLFDFLIMQVIACLSKRREPKRGSDDYEDERDAKKTWVFFEGTIQWSRAKRFRRKRGHG